ncbi:MAG: Ig-like domain-containing protein [Cyclobacteriaceae bacterium]|nr:Ig-like domain-containing protein [Cyclobacteriaceae bacterium]
MKRLLPLIAILAGCASVTSPTGGPKDDTPPELINAYPANNQKNFNGKEIELTFSEMIKLKDPKEEILITPSPGKDTKFLVKKNKLVIEPEFPWQENTTYSLNFRDGVQDLNEGNPAENLRLAFSTGPIIDSLSISGAVKETFSEKTPEKITVALYQQDTFNIFNHMPTYFTKSNKEGKFVIPNLKSGKYYVYAFDDKNKNLKVDSKTEKFAFKVDPILVNQNKDSVILTLIRIDARPLQLTAVRHTEKTSRVRFNKGIDSLAVKSEKSVNYFFGDNSSELIFQHNLINADSIKIKLLAVDSIGQQIDSTFFIKRSETKIPVETFALKESASTYNHNKRIYTHKITYNKTLSHLIPDSIYIRIDSATRLPIPLSNIAIDTIRHILQLETPAIPTDTSKSNNKHPIALILAKAAFITTEQDSSKRIVKDIKFEKEEDNGMVSIKVITAEKNFIVQLLSADDKVFDEIINVKEHTFRFVKPNEYKLRVIIDTNGNGKWDAGNFFKRNEPEKTLYYQSDEAKYSFPIRANWEYGPLLLRF